MISFSIFIYIYIYIFIYNLNYSYSKLFAYIFNVTQLLNIDPTYNSIHV